MYKINFIGFLGLCLGFSSTLYGTQQHDAWQEEKAHIASNIPASPPNAFDHKGNVKKEVSLKQNTNWTCRSIQKCKALSHIGDYMKLWAKLNHTNNTQYICEYLSSENSYGDIVGAYHHLLDAHLNSRNSSEAYQYINEEVKKIVDCDFTTCEIYSRNQRKRGKDLSSHTKEVHSTYAWKCTFCGFKHHIKQLRCQACFKNNDTYASYLMQRDRDHMFVQDLLDTMHAYLVHGYDSGHRYPKLDKNNQVDKINPPPKYDSDDMDALFDLELQQLQEWQLSIKKSQRTQSRHGRFQTKINEVNKALVHKKVDLDLLHNTFGGEHIFAQWIAYLLENECDTDNILEQIAGDRDEAVIPMETALLHKIEAYIQPQQEDKTIDLYGFGIRLYYWRYYKTSSAQDAHHPAYKEKDLYVPAAYVSFKNEMLSKGITIDKWHQKYYEAGIMLAQSSTLKKLKAPYNTEDIKRNSGLSVWHILSVLFYTNFTALCTPFRRSFRYRSSRESLQSLIKRNAKWHFLSRYLREVVELFGEEIGEQKVRGSSYYHGVSKLLYRRFLLNFYGPLSTSQQLPVTMLLSNKQGLIVELKQGPGLNYKRLRFFNASLLSCFSAEEEKLFMGGFLPLQISSMRLLKKNINTQPLMHALCVLDDMIQGKGLVNEEVCYSDIAIFEKLVAGSKSMPLYVKKIWDTFREGKKRVKIDLWGMHVEYRWFFQQLFSSDFRCKNLLLLDKIVKIFPNVTEIMCEGTDNIKATYGKGDYASDILCTSFIWHLKVMLYKISPYKRQQLKKIIISTYQYDISPQCDLLEKHFAALGWQIGKGYKTIVLQKSPYKVMHKDVIQKISAMIQAKKPLYAATSLDIPIVNQLIASPNHLPADAHSQWDKVKYKQQRITIDMEYMYRDYKLLFSLFVSSSTKNLLRIDKLVVLFPNVTEIICKNTDNITDGCNIQKGYSAAIVDAHFILALKEMLYKTNKRARLAKIVIGTYSKKINCNLYPKKFAALGWKIEKENKYYPTAHLDEGTIVLTKVSAGAASNEKKHKQCLMM